MGKDKRETLKEAMETSVHYLLETAKWVDWAKQILKQLQAENDEMEKILKPFAEFNTLIDITRNDTTITRQDFMRARDFMKARKALKKGGKSD